MKHIVWPTKLNFEHDAYMSVHGLSENVIFVQVINVVALYVHSVCRYTCHCVASHLSYPPAPLVFNRL